MLLSRFLACSIISLLVTGCGNVRTMSDVTAMTSAETIIEGDSSLPASSPKSRAALPKVAKGTAKTSEDGERLRNERYRVMSENQDASKSFGGSTEVSETSESDFGIDDGTDPDRPASQVYHGEIGEEVASAKPPRSMLPTSGPAQAAVPSDASAPKTHSPFNGNGTKATRIFAGPQEYPPHEYAAYGILAFWEIPDEADRARLTAICIAYLRAMDFGPASGTASKRQMVTVWPIRSARIAQDLMSAERSSARSWEEQCNLALRAYDIEEARKAMRMARKQHKDIDGRGPFLLAWSPTDKIGTDKAVVLSADLSKVENQLEAREIFRIWIKEIESDGAFTERGFSLNKARLKLKSLIDKYGSKFEQLFKVS